MSSGAKRARPSVTVDCVVFGLGETELEVLLIERKLPPFAGCWALPGGFVHLDESLEQAARRELVEETGLDRVYLEQLYTFGAVDRDPRERVITVAYYALVKPSEYVTRAATDASDARWFPLRQLPRLAFDHQQIVDMASERLKSKLRYQPVGFELLPAKFTLSQLQFLYEVVLERTLDKRNFRKKILALGLLDELDEYGQRDVGRPARLYRFNQRRYRQLVKAGFHFEL